VKRLVASVALSLAAAWPAAGQSSIQNARLQERPAGDLAQTVRQLTDQPGPLWIAYAVPAESPDWNACCWDNWSRGNACCGRCSLEQGKAGGSTMTIGDRQSRPVQLEAPATLLVLYRIENRRVGKVRVYSESCEIDAGGRTVYWLTGAQPSASIALLKRLVQTSGSNPDAEEEHRHVISEALLAISAHRAPEAIPALIDLARNDPATRVRSDALFWLAQRAGQKAAGTITDAIANDPDTKVKERAVFALSQLPKDEGVPKLIEVARTNRNPRVRQQAVFWLGQSKDPRALKFFEELLSR
jgi:hypothetical protein